MIRALDTSVTVPALLPWHDAHRSCHEASTGAAIAAHVMVETYSVLTRLPSPHRLAHTDASALLDRRFRDRLLVPSAALSHTIVSALAVADVSGSATYDGIIALTVAEHGARLLTRDQRAAVTYDALGVQYELVD